ncbi:hypothetical protein L596_011108 [Steinernema carpocapsae]|uniref:Uncharacterized protein n=1 Tax=Steinernema carpocapsae TaxID=34508 RepID=A0A4U5NTS3_STECR|nr:hypothetical protein L596_011108 [Steinernema carpocapsae]
MVKTHFVGISYVNAAVNGGNPSFFGKLEVYSSHVRSRPPSEAISMGIGRFGRDALVVWEYLVLQRVCARRDIGRTNLENLASILSPGSLKSVLSEDR